VQDASLSAQRLHTGHMHRSDDSIVNHFLDAERPHKKRATENTWKRDLEKEKWTAGFRYSSWRKETTALDGDGGKQVICGLCSTGSYKA